MGDHPAMSTIIAAKYGGPCLRCGDHIKAGSFVNWKRGDGIWHLDEADSKRLKLEDSYCSDTNQRGGDMNSNNDETQSGTININDLLKALQEINKTSTPTRDNLTSKQLSFCEFMALGSNKADAYTNSYDVTDPAFSNNAARKLLEDKRIRDKIAELRRELGETSTENGKQDFFDSIRSEGGKKGWAFKLTDNQETFCRSIASGATRIKAFKESGYNVLNHTDRRIRKRANELMGKPKIRIRIRHLMSGNAPNLETGKKTSRSLDGWYKETSDELADALNAEKRSRGWHEEKHTNAAADSEFVDNFVELIKAHGRLFHHAVVTRGQKEAGIPGANVEEMEEAVCKSIETLKETLSKKLSR